jgi:hypothetical protein
MDANASLKAAPWSGTIHPKNGKVHTPTPTCSQGHFGINGTATNMATRLTRPFTVGYDSNRDA